MNIVETMEKTDWPAIISRAAGVALLLAGVLLAARLCTATPQDNFAPSTLDSRSTPPDSTRTLALFVLGVTGLIFLVVFSLPRHVVVKFGSGAADKDREVAVLEIPDSPWGELASACVLLKPGIPNYRKAVPGRSWKRFFASDSGLKSEP